MYNPELDERKSKTSYTDPETIKVFMAKPKNKEELRLWYNAATGKSKFDKHNYKDMFGYFYFPADNEFGDMKAEDARWSFCKNMNVSDSDDDEEATYQKMVELMEKRTVELIEKGYNKVCISGGIDSTVGIAILKKLNLLDKVEGYMWEDYVAYYNQPLLDFVKKNMRCINIENINEGDKIPENVIIHSPAFGFAYGDFYNALHTMGIPEWCKEYTERLGVSATIGHVAFALFEGLKTYSVGLYNDKCFNNPQHFFEDRDLFEFHLSHGDQLVGNDRKYYKRIIRDILGDEIANNSRKNHSKVTKFRF